MEWLRSYYLPGNRSAPQPEHCVRGSTAHEVEVPPFLPFHISPLAGGATVEVPPPSLELGALEKLLLLSQGKTAVQITCKKKKNSIAFHKQGVEVEIGFLRRGRDNLLCQGGGRSVENHPNKI